jgi:phage-related protein
MDGYITIGANLNTKDLEKGIKKAEAELNKLDKEAKKLTDQKLTLEADNTEYEQTISNYDKLVKKAKDYENALKQIDEYKLNPRYDSTSLIDQQFEYEDKLKNINNEIQKQTDNYTKAKSKINSNKEEISEINQKIKENTTNQSQLNAKVQEMGDKLSRVRGIDTLKSSIDGISNKMTHIVKKAIKWGLAVFSIRSAYSFIRSSISNVSQYNQQISTNIEYIRWALANALKPVIEYIINLAVKLLSILRIVIKILFNYDIFANAGKDAFQKAKESSGGIAKNTGTAAKNAKEINKQLAGFDEMNILQDNKDSGSGGGAGGGGVGGTLPDFDLSKLQGEMPGWVDWILKNKDVFLAALAGIITFLKIAPGLIEKLGLKAGLLKSLGIGIAVAGLVYAIQGLLAYLKKPTWENFGKVIQGIGIAIIGLGIAFLGLPAIIVGVVVLIVGTIIKHWNEIKAFLQKGIDWLKGKSDFIHNTFGDTIGNIYDAFVGMFQGVLNGFDNMFKGFKKIFDGIILFIKGVFTGDWKKAWEGAKTILVGIFQALEGVIKGILNSIKGFAVSIAKGVGNLAVGALKAVVNTILEIIERKLNTPISAINGMIGVINKLPGVSIGKLSYFKLPRLAKGGVINNPGSGVMIGSAIAGERGAEGVIPLTDSQQMALLGEAIGRYITVNANITNTMNGRVISRELKQIQNDNNFAYNR